MQNRNNRATRANIYLNNIDYNLDRIRSLCGNNRKICAAVKADAYGHGAVEISKRVLKWGVNFLAVATVNEGIILRNAGIEAPIILFSFPLEQEIPDLVKYNLSPFVGSSSYLKSLNREAVRQNRTVGIHLKIDTGMGRIGCLPEDAPGLCRQVGEYECLVQEGICTHFPVSDSPDEEDIAFTKQQIRVFSNAVETIQAEGIDPGIVHAANSGAIIGWPEAHFDMVRPGICLYGYYPDSRMEKKAVFKPVMEMVSSVTFLKKVKKGTSVSYGRTWNAPQDTWIASISAGYGDGYNRLLSSKGRVVIKGVSYPVAGRICMDQFMVDLGPETDVELYDRVVLFGPEQPAMNAEEVAEVIGTIPYEITCNINKRVPRDYFP